MLLKPSLRYSRLTANLSYVRFASNQGNNKNRKSRSNKFQAPKAQSPGGPPPWIIETKNVPIYLYAPPEEVEKQALDQLTKLAETPLPVGYVSAMPDVHLGKGVTIGSVFATDKYVCPNAVGVDIGCGMCAVPLNGLFKDDVNLDQLKKMQKLIKQRIPTGFNQHKKPLRGTLEALDTISENHRPSKWLENQIGTNVKVGAQIGTLGGGNHFLEVVYDPLDDQVWILLHSGSRNIGNITAELYDKKAQAILAKKNIRMPPGLNYMEIQSKEGQQYLGDMQWCQKYAFRNRQAMLEIMVDVVNDVTGAQPVMERAVNIHHNYCSCERCQYTDPRTGEQVDRDLWVTRKGATSAQPGQYGIIPGSMGVGSYIVKGKGQPKAWSSCSHGAGRRMSRKAAVKKIQQSEFVDSMKGIVCDTVSKVRDEAPQAYKDLTRVMENQKDLVDIEHRLMPLVNVKGF
eukprot:TRINITY_DN4176_c0_g2_i1.p1 TRINITY_DN4176_c0_g2~~TRINITY_DN4176_c0_g2_i1.p1  ORF type:complete len:457 (-),score=60.61 TRINITY_DN4176_c0_g2_i1:348-1718(-)